MRIKTIKAYEILDSRGSPTVAAGVELEDGTLEYGLVPSGASTGSREALEKRDGGKNFNGKGVEQVIEDASNNFFPEFIGLNVEDQILIDKLIMELNGSENKEKYGANISLGLSLAVCKSCAKHLKIPLYLHINNLLKNLFDFDAEMSMPLPMMNILNGGAHANNGLDFQEFMIQPLGFSSFKEGLICGVEIFSTLKKTLNKKGFSTAVGDEGGFAPEINTSEEALELISQAISISGYELEKDVSFALDCAATEIFSGGSYNFSDNKKLNSKELVNYLISLNMNYPISSIEDGLDEDDWEGWKLLTKELGKKTQLVGDDLFVTNKNILEKGIKENVGNSILIKINQIGTLTETFETIKLAEENSYKCIISHRSGETEDSFIADLAVGSGVGQIKCGAPSRSDRTAKYNRLSMIDAQENLIYKGRSELTF